MFTLWSRHPETSDELRCWTAVMISPNAPYRSRRIVESGRESDIIMLNWVDAGSTGDDGQSAI